MFKSAPTRKNHYYWICLRKTTEALFFGALKRFRALGIYYIKKMRKLRRSKPVKMIKSVNKGSQRQLRRKKELKRLKSVNNSENNGNKKPQKKSASEQSKNWPRQLIYSFKKAF